MRKSKKEPLAVTSFRLPLDVKAFLKKKADADKRTMSFVLVEYVRRWIHFEAEEAKQPKVSS
jgi:predicted DNA-binding protein